MCDKLTGEDHLKTLMIDWGYEAILPENKAPEFALHHVIHFSLGIIILAAGMILNLFLGFLLKTYIFRIFRCYFQLFSSSHSQEIEGKSS